DVKTLTKMLPECDTLRPVDRRSLHRSSTLMSQLSSEQPSPESGGECRRTYASESCWIFGFDIQDRHFLILINADTFIGINGANSDNLRGYPGNSYRCPGRSCTWCKRPGRKCRNESDQDDNHRQRWPIRLPSIALRSI